MAPPDHALLTAVLFRVGGVWCGLEAGLVRGAERARASAATDDIETRLLPRLSAARGMRYRLCLHGARGPWFLNVAAPLELAQVPARAIQPLPPLLAARPPLRGLRALAWHNGQLLLLLDARRLEDRAIAG